VVVSGTSLTGLGKPDAAPSATLVAMKNATERILRRGRISITIPSYKDLPRKHENTKSPEVFRDFVVSWLI
jgi:hypothetical protein